MIQFVLWPCNMTIVNVFWMQNLSGTVFNITEFEDTKGAMGTCISKKNIQHNGQKKSTKGQTTIHKTYT